MGCIYKIINDVNDKVYIGMTKTSLEKRWSEHINSYNNPNKRTYNFKLYKAMREIGLTHFSCVLIEKVEDNLLSYKEKYYIDKFDSSFYGYNESLGGNGKTLISNLKIKAFYDLYLSGWLLTDIARVFDSNYRTVGIKLREHYDVDTSKNALDKSMKPVRALKDDLVVDFPCMRDAALYVIKNKLSKTDKIETVMSKIRGVLKDSLKTAYGLKWSYI